MAAPVSLAEFGAAMDRLGPWDAARRVAVAVSGGPDSLALALLARRWGDPIAFVVDHRLRPESAAEATAASAILEAHGLPATVLPLVGLQAGPGLAERARAARYAALSAACRGAGLVDLLLGHHAGDQAETVLLRRRAGSGPRGLAAMAALSEITDIRLLRPLLGYAPDRLAAVVAAAGLTAASDPTNTDLRTTRARLRHEIGADRTALLAEAGARARERGERDAELAAELAQRVQFFPGGFALLSPGPLPPDALAAVLRTISGRRYPVTLLPTIPHPATLAGTRILPAGKLGDGWLLVREEAAMAGPAFATPGAVWDGRFRVVCAPSRTTLSALGGDAAKLRHRSHWPAAVLRALPALRRDGTLSEVPHLEYADAVDEGGASGRAVVHSAVVPATGAAFVAC